MRKRLLLVGVLAIAIVVPMVALAANKPVSAKLTGKAETPKGDPNGSGFVVVQLDKSKGKVCWTFSKIKNIGTPMAAHIHKGKKGVAGPVVIPLGAAYKAKGCITAKKHDIGEILEYPDRYYVNIHNSAFPNGAIRGQLALGTKG
jgi:CHRD domain